MKPPTKAAYRLELSLELCFNSIMSKASKGFRDQAAGELRASRKRGGIDQAEHVKRAASYKALADNEEWLEGDKSRSRPRIKSLMTCPKCSAEMRLFGIEPESDSDIRELYTFECTKCGKLEVRGVLVALPYSG